MAETTFYLTVEPEFWGSSIFNEDRVRSIKVRNVTQKRPKGARWPVVKLTLRIPDAAFMPLAPEVVVEVPERNLDMPTVTVEEVDG